MVNTVKNGQTDLKMVNNCQQWSTTVNVVQYSQKLFKMVKNSLKKTVNNGKQPSTTVNIVKTVKYSQKKVLKNG